MIRMRGGIWARRGAAQQARAARRLSGLLSTKLKDNKWVPGKPCNFGRPERPRQAGGLPLTTGKTLEETETNIREVIEGHTRTLREFGDSVPQTTSIAKQVEVSAAA
jgi:hypothetical protein